jgi:hypothetical protein
MRIVVVISWSILEKDNWLLVKHLRVGLITFHVFKECDVIFDFALRLCNVMRLFNFRQLVSFPVIVLESNLMLLSRIESVRVIWSWSSFRMLFLSLCQSCLALAYLYLKWQISRLLIWIMSPKWMATLFS